MRVISLDGAEVLPSIGSLSPMRIGVTSAAPSIAAQLVERLKAHYADAEILSPQNAARVDTIILTEGLADLTASERHWRVVEACQALRNTDVRIVLLEQAGVTALGQLSGMQGLSRTLQQEWPGRSVSAWSVDGIALQRGDFEDVIKALGARTGDAVLMDGIAHAQNSSRDAHVSLQHSGVSNVWLVSGGARGVTAACIIELAKRQPGSVFLLAGRSPIVSWPAGMQEADDVKDVRSALINMARQKGEKPALPDIDRQARTLLAGREVRSTLVAIQAAGATAVYFPVDVSDEVSVKSIVAQMVREYGPVTGLVHGAGVLADGLLIKKTRVDLERVFQPKVQGLMNLLGAIDMAALRYVGLFSSAAAVFGNVGQSDYAMANAWLNATARQLHADLPDAIVKSFCWGPWEGGMVDATLAAHFTSKGIRLIGLDDGACIFADQILAGIANETVLLVGDEWSA